MPTELTLEEKNKLNIFPLRLGGDTNQIGN